MKRKHERHHYVPQFYLNHWCTADGKLWVHPVSGDNAWRSRPEKIAREKGLYWSQQGGGKNGLEIESWLSRVETAYAPEWPNIFKKIGDPRIKWSLALYLALQYLRHPKQKSIIAHIRSQFTDFLGATLDGEKRELLPAPTPELNNLPAYDAATVLSELLNEENSVDRSFLEMTQDNVAPVAEILLRRKWGLIESDEDVFATSDSPISLNRGKAEARAFGLGTIGTEITFAVSPKLMLCINDEWEQDSAYIPPDLFSFYCERNRTVFNIPAKANAARFIYSSSKVIQGLGE